jgi:hypothetical protein
LTNWNYTARALVGAEVEKLPQHGLIFLSAYVFEEDADFDEMVSRGGIWLDGIVNTVIAKIAHNARRRNLDPIGPDRGDVIGYEIQGSGMFWWSDRGEAMDLIASYADIMIDPDTDLPELADKLVEAMIAVANEDAEGGVVAELLERIGNEVRSPLLDRWIATSSPRSTTCVVRRSSG